FRPVPADIRARHPWRPRQVADRAELPRRTCGPLRGRGLLRPPACLPAGMTMPPASLSADEVIRLFELKPHPAGGHFRETFRDPRRIEGRAASTAVYYLLVRGERSHWHHVDAAEVWHYYAGAALSLSIAEEGRTASVRLGADIAAGERPQAIVPAGAWQAAGRLGDWPLVGCTAAPGLGVARFTPAPPGRAAASQSRR